MTSATNFFNDDAEVLVTRIENDTKRLLSKKEKATFTKNYELITAVMATYENRELFDRHGLQVLWNIVPPKAQFCNSVPIACLAVSAKDPDAWFLPASRATAWPSVVCTDDHLLMTKATEKKASRWAAQMIHRCDEILEWLGPFVRTQAFARAIAKVEPIEPTCLLCERGEKVEKALPWARWAEQVGMAQGWRPLSERRIEAVRKMYEQSIAFSLESFALAVMGDVANGRAGGVFKVTGFLGAIAAGVAIRPEPSALVIDFAVHPRIPQDYFERYSVSLDWARVYQAVGVNYDALMAFQSLNSCGAKLALILAAAHAKTAWPATLDTEDFSGILASVADEVGLT
jgi:hypothetical protein